MKFFNRFFKTNNRKHNSASDNQIAYSAGDIFYTQSDNQYRLCKLLHFDRELETCHVLIYKPLDKLPDVSDIDNLDISIYHAPFDMKAYKSSVFLVNGSIKCVDLIGYHEYLRQTQAPGSYFPIVDGYYQSGLILTDEKMYEEAIDEYSKAIDLFRNSLRRLIIVDFAKWIWAYGRRRLRTLNFRYK